MHDIDTDVCISGGGPAGLVLALLVARSGLDVVVVERTTSFDRSYRGEILQPGAQRALDQLGVLQPVSDQGGCPMPRFQLVERDRVLMDIDYGRLPAPYNRLFSVPQRTMLENLYAACSATPGFRQLSGCSTTAVLTDGDVVTGVRCRSAGDERTVRARWVVAADGRYSKTRKAAGIGYDRIEAFEHDVLWLKLDAPSVRTGAVRIYRAGGNPVLLHDSFPDRLQVGWTLPHGGYRAVAEHGIDHIRQQLADALPPYADLIREQITRLTDLSPLDVFSGRAREWVRDGLVLIGDCAHTHSPIGAQGINLAIQDAVELHPALVSAVRAGDARRSALTEFERSRRSAADTVFRLQAKQSVGMLSTSPVVNALRPVVAKLLPYTPLYRKVLSLIAFGAHPVNVRTDLFSAPGSGSQQRASITRTGQQEESSRD